jgi:hypothetical protein
VQNADRVAYITTNHEGLDAYLERQFEDNGIGWNERHIGDYHIYYNLSRKISPQEIGLGMTTQP